MSSDERQQAIRRALIVLGGIAAGIVVAAAIVAAQNFAPGQMGAGQDARAYWLALRQPMYTGMPGTHGAYLYSPAFVELFSLVLTVEWEQFFALWTVLLVGTMLALSGPVLLVLVLPIAFFELWGGNVNLLLTMAIVIGFRFPAAWAFVLLTKITPGIGLLWFAARSEWRALGIAIGATIGVICASWLVAPNSWSEWLNLLARGASMDQPPGSLPLPLWLRLPVAAALVVFAARTDRRWIVPLAALVAMPVIWGGAATLLVGAAALERQRLEEIVVRGLAGLDALRTTASRRLAVDPET